MRILAALLVALLACGPLSADAVSDVEAATQQWITAFNRKDARAIFALYARDAILFGTASGTLRDKPELVWDYFKGIADLGEATISTGDHRVQVFGDVAINTGYYTRASMQDGKEVKNPARFTFVYQRREGKWMIVNHHSSALP